MTPLDQPRKLLSIPTTAGRLDVSITTVRRLIRRGELPALRVGTQFRIDPDELEEWLNRSRASGGPANPTRATGPAVRAVEPVGAPGPEERSTQR